jgi:hypothetical protein
MTFIFQRIDPRRNLSCNAGSNRNTILESRDGSCTEQSQRNIIRRALVEELWPKHIKKYHCREHKIRRTICIKGRYSTFERKGFFSVARIKTSTLGPFTCVLCEAHIFQCQSIKSWRSVFQVWRQAPCIVQLSQQRDLCVSAQRVTR